jgi:TRAP-type C4-dicarboxylate transport system permease small subunit
MRLEETLGLIITLLYMVHFFVFAILSYRQYKNAGVKSSVLVIVFLFILFFVALQVGGFIAQIFILAKGKDSMTLRLKAIYDTIAISLATLIELPIWLIFLKKKKT